MSIRLRRSTVPAAEPFQPAELGSPGLAAFDRAQLGARSQCSVGRTWVVASRGQASSASMIGPGLRRDRGNVRLLVTSRAVCGWPDYAARRRSGAKSLTFSVAMRRPA